MKNLLFIFIPLIHFSCANIGTLGGGKVDDQPPLIVNTNITKTNFNSKKIIIEFNEYIVPNNPEKNITLQPRHTTLKFVFLSKKLVIYLDSALKQNTTYNLIIDKGVSDNNANNHFSYANTFSTGNTIDSGNITVKLNAYKDLKYLKIALSSNNGADSFKSFSTDYIFDVNKSMIQFNGLNDTKYNLWLFTDENNDEKPDFYKPINFLQSPEQDSMYELEPKTWYEPLRLIKAISDNKTLKINYTHSISCNEKIYQTFRDLKPSFLYITSDSAMIFISDTNGLSSRLKIHIQIVPHNNFKKEIKNMVDYSISITRLKNDFQIRFSKPLYYLENNSKINIEEIKLKTKKIDSFILFPNNDTSQIPDTFYIKNKSISDYKSMAYFNLIIKNKKGNKYDLVILKENKTYLKTYQMTEYENYLQPGLYKIQIYENSINYIFNPFILSPFPKKLYEKEISLKANWEEILNVILE